MEDPLGLVLRVRRAAVFSHPASTLTEQLFRTQAATLVLIPAAFSEGSLFLLACINTHAFQRHCGTE